ncbi:MAG: hypothetical protein PHQ80_01640 [Candidatus ainarchaeum sp.]|nr:hypothetical protein [Candidatus ainarchaeum sp.]MDD5096607.1 hypothetical protein [Candidatus ainarchaeum sp.]
MNSQTYEVLNKAWKSTCRILLGAEIGDMKEYEPWLLSGADAPKRFKSSISGKDVYVGIGSYKEDGKFIGMDEIDFSRKFEPLGINQVKDIDSIVGALKERFLYTGNIILGNSNFVEKGANIMDSSYIYNATDLLDSKYIAHLSIAPESEYCFGSNGAGSSKHCIRVYETYDCNRCLEIWNSRSCADGYFTYNCDGCNETFFTFNSYGKKYAIGNLELPRDKYLQLKKKLLAEIREQLISGKRLDSLMDIVSSAKECKKEHEELKTMLKGHKFDEPRTNKEIIEKEFSETSSILLGKPLYGMDNYSKWLTSKIWKRSEANSALTGRRTVVVDYCNLGRIPEHRLIRKDEWELIKEKMKLTEPEVDSLTVANAGETIGKIAYMPFDYNINSTNMIDCTTTLNSSDCYLVIPSIFSKKSGVCTWIRHSSDLFGCCAGFNSSFCMKMNYSKRMNRCFEADNSSGCSGGYFLHNCENVRDSMFCFNVKNLSNSIGNAPLPLDKYKSVRSSLLEQMHSELEKNKELKWDIYSIGCH